MRFKFNPLTFEQKLALRRSAEDSLNAMNPLWGEFRKAATAPAIISLLDSLDEQAQELHKAKMALADAGCVLVEWKQRTEAAEQLSQQLRLTIDSIQSPIAHGQERITELEGLATDLAAKLQKTQDSLKYALLMLSETKMCNTEPGQNPAIAAVVDERLRQVNVKGWTPEHDDEHVNDEIAAFAALYAMPEACRDWSAEETGYGENWAEAICPNGWAAKFGDRRRELVKAGALILAEIERLDRVSNEKGENHE
ncbi:MULTISPECIES: hypothetical protein [unclassified Serratia (in: enterobacteria)]|uniref:hypothetical protein n=1 Tax=unclassified Serratia (in: enterobacteria) TaxID=2647522 RepID=UPI00046A60A9|nr:MULTISPECIES: hypothetical protein [unclassified Serratia (in: enterobacteria)]